MPLSAFWRSFLARAGRYFPVGGEGGSSRQTTARLLVLFGAYALLHAVITRAAGPSLALDDVKLNVLAQSWQAGYLPQNPPLFEWLLRLAQLVAGPTVASFLIVKSAALLIAGLAVFGAAREAGAAPRAAMLAALSMLATYQIGVAWHETLTHTVLAFAASTAFLWAMLRLLRTMAPADALIVGLIAGAGLMSKYSFAGVALALFLAMAMNARGRTALRPFNLLLILAPALAISAPHLAWKIDGPASTETETVRTVVDRIVSDAPSALWAVASFLAPLLILRRLQGPFAIGGPVGDAAPAAPLAATAMLIGALMLVLAALSGFGAIDERYAAPFMAPAFVLLALSLGRAPSKRFSYALAVSVAAIASVRIAALIAAGPPFCEQCRQYVDYAPLRQAIGDGASATLVGYDDHTAGNLRRLYPHARVLSSHMPFYAPPGGRAADRCVFVWSEDLDLPPPEAVTRAPREVLAIDAPRARSFGRSGEIVRFQVADFTGDAVFAPSLCRLPGK